MTRPTRRGRRTAAAPMVSYEIGTPDPPTKPTLKDRAKRLLTLHRTSPTDRRT